MDTHTFYASSKRLLTSIAALLISLSLHATAAIPEQNSARNDAKCANIKTLYREVSPANRVTRFTPSNDTILLSKHYCIGFFGQGQSPSFKLNNAAKLAQRYYTVGKLLRTDAEKTALAHTLLKQLSQKKLVLPRSDIDNQLTIILPSKRKDGTNVNLNLNLSFSTTDLTAVKSGLEYLATVDDDSQWLEQTPGIEDLAKWIINGNGTTDYFDEYTATTLLPDNDGSSCPTFENCQINYGEIIGDSSSYDWDRYASVGFYLSLEDGRRWEEEQCSVHNDCIVYDYDNDEYGDGETCIGVTYSDGTTVDGLYCEVHEDP